MQQTDSWSFFKKIKFSFISFVLLLLFLEIGARIIFYINYHSYNTTPYIQGSPLQISNSDLVFINTPNYIDYNKKYQNNNLGFKSILGDFAINKKTKNEFRVLLLGASAMEGMGSNKNGEWFDITGVSDYAANESISYYLQKELQKAMPTKKVIVYNGATSSYVLWQSMQRYLKTKNIIQPDYVISLDGNNEFPALQINFNKKQLIKNAWEEYPIFKSPAKYIIPITQYSFLLNSLKKFLYDFKTKKREYENKQNDFPIRKKWLETKAKLLLFSKINDSIIRAVNNYREELIQFDSLLINDNMPHTLIYQPYLFMKDGCKQSNTEKALFNYYTNFNNDSTVHTYKTEVIKQVEILSKTNNNLILLQANNIPVSNFFVDYCHYTLDGNKWFASYFCDIILQNNK